ncbi:MAG: hypothetical protein WAU54_03925 [Chania sp.]
MKDIGTISIQVSADIPPEELAILKEHLSKPFKTNNQVLVCAPPSANLIDALRGVRRHITPKNVNEAIENAVTDMIVEYHSAVGQHTNWPTDAVHAAAILGEESGETLQAALNFHYGNGDADSMVEEAIQTGAMAIRFIINAGTYKLPTAEDDTYDFDGGLPF